MPGRDDRRSPSRILPLALGAVVLALTGCETLRPATVPIDALSFAAGDGPREKLIVLLPGRGSAAGDFEARGWIAAAKQRDPAIDVVAVEAHFGYYRTRTLVERLWVDVVGPAKGSGYREIWIVGTSMGGLGAVAFTHAHAGAVTGMILLSPYLGKDELLAEIDAAGGLAQWPGRDEDGTIDQLWTWLKGYPKGRPRPELLLAFGERDRLNAGHELLAAALPAGRVLRTPGGHGWATWNPLWDEVLERLF